MVDLGIEPSVPKRVVYSHLSHHCDVSTREGTWTGFVVVKLRGLKSFTILFNPTQSFPFKSRCLDSNQRHVFTRDVVFRLTYTDRPGVQGQHCYAVMYCLQGARASGTPYTFVTEADSPISAGKYS